MATNFNGFPDDMNDPRLKGKEWFYKHSEAVLNNPNGIVPNSDYYYKSRAINEIKSYAQGRQDTNRYKRTPLGRQIAGESWLATDFTPIAIIPKIREMLISQLLQREFDVQAFAVDPISLAEEDTEFTKMKLKVLARDIAKGTPLQDNPAIKRMTGEAEDLESLELSKEFGYKSTMTMVAEDAISMVLQQNDIDEKRKQNIESLIDAGIGGYDIWIDAQNNVRFDACETSSLVCSYASKNDFSDAAYIGNIEPMMVSDLAQWFDVDDLAKICESAKGEYDNPRFFDNNIAPFKVMVLNVNLISIDTQAYKRETNSKGNDDVLKVDFKYTSEKYKPREATTTPKFATINRKSVYKYSRVMGTDFMFNYGPKENQGRKVSKWWDVKFDKILNTWNKYRMSWVGLTERLIPIADRYQLVWQKIQNIDAKTIPYVMNVNFSQLENVIWGASTDANGGKWTPLQIMDFIMQNYTAVFRTEDLNENERPNFSPVTFSQTPQLAMIAELTGELQFLISQIYDISGLNQGVAGNPDSKMLTTGLQMQQQATNNALYLMSKADEKLYLNLCEAIFLKVQIAVKRGNVEGYVRALGSQAVKFLKINPDISNREYAIFLKDAPTREQRLALYQEMQTNEAKGLLNPMDIIIISETRNIKMAWRYLAKAIKDAQEDIHRRQIEMQQQQSNGNMQVAIEAEKAKRETLKLQGQIEIQKETVKGQWQYYIEKMKKGSDIDEANVHANAKVLSSRIIASAKSASASL